MMDHAQPDKTHLQTFKKLCLSEEFLIFVICLDWYDSLFSLLGHKGHFGILKNDVCTKK